jgi:O-antigen ligase
MRKITFWLTLALIFTIPWEDSLRLAIGSGTSVTKLIGFGVAGFWLLTVLMEGRFNKPQLFHAFALFFMLWSILSYIWTVDLKATFPMVSTYAQLFLLLLIFWDVLQKPEELQVGIQVYILGAFVLIGSTLLNYVNGTAAVSYEVRYSATGVNAVDLPIFLLIGVPMAWFLFNHPIKNNRLLKLINVIYVPLSVFAVLLTASRTSLFAILPAAIFIAWPKRLDAARILVTAIGLVIAAIVLQAILPGAILERLSSAATSISSADMGGRVNLWRDTIAVFEQHPLIGAGSGTMTDLIGAFSHQTFLSVLAETGLIGFAFFFLVVFYMVMEIFRLPKGYLGLWLSTFMVWLIGVLTVTFEFRKITWLLFSFIIIQGNSLRKQWQVERIGPRPSEAEETAALPVYGDRPILQDLTLEDKGPIE